MQLCFLDFFLAKALKATASILFRIYPFKDGYIISSLVYMETRRGAKKVGNMYLLLCPHEIFLLAV